MLTNFVLGADHQEPPESVALQTVQFVLESGSILAGATADQVHHGCQFGNYLRVTEDYLRMKAMETRLRAR